MVSILIINWNKKQLIADCLSSIHAKITVPYEVFFLDNNSADGSADFVAENFPWVNLIRSQENLGFIRGNNLLATYANGEHILLYNNDTILQTDIADAVAAIDADPRIGAVGAAMFGIHGEPRISTARFPSAVRLWRFASLLYTALEPYPSPSPVPLLRCDWVEGSFLLTRTELWRQVGGLDEGNFMYGDDFDYCRMMLELGLATVQCPSVRYTHLGGYDHSKMGYLFTGFRRYHRKFSSKREQLAADFVLRTGILLRIPLYAFRAVTRKDPASRSAFKHALELNRNWAATKIDAPHFHS